MKRLVPAAELEAAQLRLSRALDEKYIMEMNQIKNIELDSFGDLPIKEWVKLIVLLLVSSGIGIAVWAVFGHYVSPKWLAPSTWAIICVFFAIFYFVGLLMEADEYNALIEQEEREALEQAVQNAIVNPQVLDITEEPK